MALINLSPCVLKEQHTPHKGVYLCVCVDTPFKERRGEFHAPALEAGMRGEREMEKGTSSPAGLRRQSLTPNQEKTCRGKLKGPF